MSDLTFNLIEFQSKRMDVCFMQEIPQLADFLHNPEQNNQQSSMMVQTSPQVQKEQPQDNTTQLDSDEQSQNLQSNQTKHNLHKHKLIQRTPSTKISRTYRKDKKIRSQNQDSGESQDFYRSIYTKLFKKSKKNQPKSGYPTKNFLPNAKKCHYDYLDKKLGSDFVNSIQFACDLRNKSGISLKDYEILYKIPQFQQTFIEFFASKELFRYLMLSRSILQVKLIHIKKMGLFQRAFYRKQFTHIN